MAKIEKLKPSNKEYKYGVFDIETAGLNAKAFKFGVVKVDGTHFVFEDKEKMLNFMLKKEYEGYNFYAHNGEYDLSGLFENIIGDLKPEDSILYSGSNLISLKICTRKESNGKNHKEKRFYVTFLDSMNYFQTSLENLGNAIGMKKLKEIVDYEVMEINKNNIYYCKRDCDILEESLKQFFTLLNSYGVTPKLTIASNALAVFRTAFLEKDYNVNVKYDDVFKLSYFGGRTEVFKHEVGAGQCYDFNSLYPSVMISENKYPDPSKLRMAFGLDELFNILEDTDYEGVAYITVKCTNNIPLLPFKHENKLYFPTSKNGDLSGYYNFPEIREALKSGYEIIKAGEIIYSIGINSPFGEYVETLYKLRQEYKKAGSSMELFVKYMLNSLYGKFGQSDEIAEIGDINDIENHDGETFELFPNSESIGYWKSVDSDGIVQRERSEHTCYCWCSYVTSYARVKLYQAFKKLNFNVAYCDTDSVFTPIEMDNSSVLGDVKEEYKYNSGNFIKPKHYTVQKLGKYESSSFITYDVTNKLKGVRNVQDVTEEIQPLTKVMKNKEAMHTRKINPKTGLSYRAGESLTIIKHVGMNDNKRSWVGNESKPLDVRDILK